MRCEFSKIHKTVSQKILQNAQSICLKGKYIPTPITSILGWHTTLGTFFFYAGKKKILQPFNIRNEKCSKIRITVELVALTNQKT